MAASAALVAAVAVGRRRSCVAVAVAAVVFAAAVAAAEVVAAVVAAVVELVFVGLVLGESRSAQSRKNLSAPPRHLAQVDPLQAWPRNPTD